MQMEKHILKLIGSAKLQGLKTTSRGSKKPVYAFLGIPYATPPVRELRFKPPKPLTLWNGIRDASKYGPICAQNRAAVGRTYYPFPIPEEMAEDCLYLNVWTPNTSQDAKLPVMVWIHGGAFVEGFSNYYDGTAYAARQDVVYVSINYRIGVFGFLCLGDASAPGNMGLLDQVEALKWVQKHIQAFGGDPQNVTVFGESAGGISINLLLLSELAKGLFHKAICQSGVSLHPAALWSIKNAQKYVYGRLAKMGFKGTSSQEVLQFLSDHTGESLVKAMGRGFNPVLDGFFITEDPLTLYKKNCFHDVHLMLGFTSDEGASFIFDLLHKKSVSSKLEAEQLVTYIITKMFFRGHPRAKAITEAVWDKYFQNTTDVEMITRVLVEMYGDLLFVAPSFLVAQMHSERADTYMYKYSYINELIKTYYPDWVISDHGQEVPFVTGEMFLQRMPDVWTDSDKAFSHTIMSYWANFAKQGDPNGTGLPIWKKYQRNNEQFIVLDNKLSQHCQIDKNVLNFWACDIPSILNNTASKY